MAEQIQQVPGIPPGRPITLQTPMTNLDIGKRRELIGLAKGQRLVSTKGRVGTISGLNITQGKAWINLDSGGIVPVGLSKFPTIHNKSLTRENFIAPGQLVQ